jgi:hypothetical protein
VAPASRAGAQPPHAGDSGNRKCGEEEDGTDEMTWNSRKYDCCDREPDPRPNERCTSSAPKCAESFGETRDRVCGGCRTGFKQRQSTLKSNDRPNTTNDDAGQRQFRRAYKSTHDVRNAERRAGDADPPREGSLPGNAHFRCGLTDYALSCRALRGPLAEAPEFRCETLPDVDRSALGPGQLQRLVRRRSAQERWEPREKAPMGLALGWGSRLMMLFST